MKRKKSSVRKKRPSFILTYFSAFFLILIIGVFIFPADDTNTVMVPDWFYSFAMLVPLFIAIIRKWSGALCKMGGKLRGIIEDQKIMSKIINPNNEFRVPRTKKGQEELAAELLLDAETYSNLANKSKSIASFVRFYDNLLECFRKLSMLNKASFRGNPKDDFLRLKNETQWHMCDALNRQKETVISEIREKYKNSREFQEKQYENFKNDIDKLRPRFSKNTSEFADECLVEIENILGIPSANIYSTLSNHVTYTGISEIDYMDGHTFEHWCAELLKKNGFINVEVTQGSGDQGVDILAVKDGIKYAIQCKCYSSDLGNKPIQEVNTGRAIYHCQIGAVMTNRYFTVGGKEAAEATGVLLWDRDKLNEMLKRSLEVGQ